MFAGKSITDAAGNMCSADTIVPHSRRVQTVSFVTNFCRRHHTSAGGVLAAVSPQQDCAGACVRTPVSRELSAQPGNRTHIDWHALRCILTSYLSGPCLHPFMGVFRKIFSQ